jgi:trk system potassium uptake protein TrkA
VDVTISSTDLILEAIEREVPTHPLTHLLTIDEKGLVIVDVKISPESTTVGKTVKELALPEKSNLVLIIPQQGGARTPTPGAVLQAGDQVIAVTTPDSEEALRSALSGT